MKQKENKQTNPHKNKMTTKREMGKKERKPNILTNTRFFSETAGWFYVLSMIQYIWARGNSSQNNVGLFMYKMYILVVITHLDFWKPYLRLTC